MTNSGPPGELAPIPDEEPAGREVPEALPLEALALDPTQPEVVSTEPEGYVAISSIASWLNDRGKEIDLAVETLRATRPSLFAHPIQRYRYYGAVCVQRGRRQLINHASQDLVHRQTPRQ